MNTLSTYLDILVQWLSDGLSGASVWQIILYTLLMTHVTIAAVTIFLHRSQAHRSLDLGPVPQHFFRFWLWLTTGIVTKQWVAVHRKHHAKCETDEDPHSPQIHGIKTVLLKGAELYRTEARLKETQEKYGHGVPNDWLERTLYTPRSVWGPSLMLIIDLALFGAAGATVWAIQMLWIPINAAGIVNGLGHWWGYRNFEASDASTNISPWGVIIGGEELHNNHHTYPTSAKLSVKPHEFDIGWGYIRALEMLGWAKVRKVAPQLRLGPAKEQPDNQTLQALIANRYEVMAAYANELKAACASELARLKAEGARGSAKWRELELAQRWLHRDESKIPGNIKSQVLNACTHSAVLAKLVAMRAELTQIWTRTNASAEQLVADLQAWCKKAEESGIASLKDFSLKLRAAQMPA